MFLVPPKICRRQICAMTAGLRGTGLLCRSAPRNDETIYFFTFHSYFFTNPDKGFIMSKGCGERGSPRIIKDIRITRPRMFASLRGLPISTRSVAGGRPLHRKRGGGALFGTFCRETKSTNNKKRTSDESSKTYDNVDARSSTFTRW